MRWSINQNNHDESERELVFDDDEFERDQDLIDLDDDDPYDSDRGMSTQEEDIEDEY
ncbi:hypothetical protein J4436_01670 [Candidatus Woesearchaeota archaeon]|nr:hypothetical protein [Candidatus Woesearchaeota archaeon]